MLRVLTQAQSRILRIRTATRVVTVETKVVVATATTMMMTSSPTRPQGHRGLSAPPHLLTKLKLDYDYD